MSPARMSGPGPGGSGSNGPGVDGQRAAPFRDPEEVRRHESHLVSQIYHLIEANQKLEEQIDRLSKVTEIAALFRERRITPDTFELQAPSVVTTSQAQQAWSQIEVRLNELPAGPALAQLRDLLGLVRAADRQVDADWLADVRSRLIAAEQAIAFLNEQTREMDMLRREKDAIVDGAARLEQNIDDLWKALNEKTTHIQRLESQLQRIWESKPYRAFAAVRRGFKPKQEDKP
jgi:hypothetical protein